MGAIHLIQSRAPLIIAHRGFSKLAPENTLPSFRLGVASKANLIELDYHHSRDGVPIVIHDSSLKRTTDAVKQWGEKDIQVIKRDIAALRSLDAGSWFGPAFEGTRLPTLQEALDLIQPCSMTLIERKGGDPGTLIKLLRPQELWKRVVVQSFDWDFIRECRSLDARMVLGALGPPGAWQGRQLSDSEKMLNPEFIAAIAQMGGNIAVWNRGVTKESIALAHRQGLRVWVYTIDDPAEAKQLIGLGVDGIITNDPEVIREALIHSAETNAGLLKERTIPRPLDNHPGNIHLEGEAFSVAIPQAAGTGVSWRMTDVEGKVVHEGRMPLTARLSLEPQPVGWYRIDFLNEKQEPTGWTSAAVLAAPKAPIPVDSPICLDVAASWFARNSPSNQNIHANLAALAGVNWIRDRMTWREMEPKQDEYSARGNYDEAADLQAKQGLKVLQVFHSIPRWACADSDETGRFAPDLRHVHRFAREMGGRFKGRVLAWEPWNEANVSSFGGHTMDEICSWQKAAWLGFKASNPDIIVGWSPLAGVPTRQQTEAVLLNEVSPYFDTYNIHSYDWAQSYRDLWEPVRVAARGKPLWITEADRGGKHDNQAPWYDLPKHMERLKAEYVAQSYASGLMAGADRYFQFVLGNYQEPNGVQFGLLRLDFTPRPAYSALAALGRFLAGARVAGLWHPAPDVNVAAFQALPDGEKRDVLVLWTERQVDWEERGKASAKIIWPFPMKPLAVYDFMGRFVGRDMPVEAKSAPLYVVLPRGQAGILPLDLIPHSEPIEEGIPSRLVLQTIFPAQARLSIEDKPWSGGFAYAVKPGEKTVFTLCGYNFGDASSPLEVNAQNIPEGWTLSASHWIWNLDPMARNSVAVEISCEPNAAKDACLVLRGRSPNQPDAVVALRVMRK